MCAKNMWGNLGELELIKTPTSILREQGSILFDATKGVLTGSPNVQPRGDQFLIDFDIVARYLNGYRYTLFTVIHGIKIYPLKLENKVHKITQSCETEERFQEVVEQILSSKETREIVRTLISQSK